MIEKRLRQFRRPHCGSLRIDETYVKIRGKWRYLYRTIDKHGNPVDLLLTAKRDFNAARRFFCKALKDEPLLAPTAFDTDGAGVYPTAIREASENGLATSGVTHRVSKHLQQRIESDHFRVKRTMPKVRGFRTLATARRTIAGLEAMLWLRKGSGLVGTWTVKRQNELLGQFFKWLTKHEIGAEQRLFAAIVH